MSHIVNEQWMEAAAENFHTAIEQGNYEACQDIIADVRDISVDSAKVLEEELANTPIGKFSIPSVDSLIAHLSKFTGI